MNRRRVQRWSLVLITCLVALLFSTRAYAFTSLNSCLSTPSCAAMLGVTGGSSVPAGIATTALPTAAATAVAQTAGMSTGLKVLFAGGAASLGPLALHTMSPDDVSEYDSLFQSSPDPDPSVGGDYSGKGGVTVRYYDTRAGVGYRTRAVLSYAVQPNPNTSSNFNYLRGVNCDGSPWPGMDSSGRDYVPSSKTITPTVTATGSCFPSPPPEQQGETEQGLKDKLGTPVTVRPAYDNDGQQKYGQPVVFPDGGVVVGPDNQPRVVPPGGSYDPNTDLIKDPTTDPTTDPATDPNSPDPANVNDPNNPDFGTAPGPSEAIPEPDFQGPHFLVHAKNVFAEKFPLDIIGDFGSAGGSEACPVFGPFFGWTHEICPLVNIVNMVKVPSIVAFIIWAVLTL